MLRAPPAALLEVREHGEERLGEGSLPPVPPRGLDDGAGAEVELGSAAGAQVAQRLADAAARRLERLRDRRPVVAREADAFELRDRGRLLDQLREDAAEAGIVEK